MINTSEEYKALIDEGGNITGIVGTLTLTSGEVIPFDNNDIASVPEIDGQCSGDSDLILGQAYQSQLRISLYSETDRYSVYGASIELSFQLLLDDDSVEEIPLGVFTVSECIRKSDNVIEITALDNINKLDLPYTDVTLSGRPADLLQAVNRLTGVELGQTELEIAQLPNGTAILGLPVSPNINTYRDVVGDLAAVLGGFAIMGRDGKLIIKSFNRQVVKTVSADLRKSETISDFNLNYTKVSCIKQGVYFSVGDDKGQELELGENSFLQLGTDETINEILNNLLEVFGGYSYTPTAFEFTGDPAVELGDMIEITGYGAKVSTLVPVHKMTWKWRGNHKVEAVGQNPYLNTASKEERQQEAQKNTAKALENTVLNMNNSSRVILSDNWVNLGSVKFTMSSEQYLLFNGVVKANMVNGGTVRFKYLMNGIEHDFIHECLTTAGINTFTLFIPVKPKNNESNEFKVMISSDAVGSIETLDFRGAISGSGIIESSWSGLITIEDKMGVIRYAKAVFKGGIESFNIGLIAPVKTVFEEVLAPITYSKSPFGGVVDSMAIRTVADIYERVLEDGSPRITEDGTRRRTLGGYS